MALVWGDARLLLQPLRWRCFECVIHHERDVREEQQYIYVAQTSNNRVIVAWKFCRYQRVNDWTWGLSYAESATVACCHAAKLCAHAAPAFPISTPRVQTSLALVQADWCFYWFVSFLWVVEHQAPKQKIAMAQKVLLTKVRPYLIFVNVSNEKTFFLACDFFTAISLSRSLSIA